MTTWENFLNKTFIILKLFFFCISFSFFQWLFSVLYLSGLFSMKSHSSPNYLFILLLSSVRLFYRQVNHVKLKIKHLIKMTRTKWLTAYEGPLSVNINSCARRRDTTVLWCICFGWHGFCTNRFYRYPCFSFSYTLHANKHIAEG